MSTRMISETVSRLDRRLILYWEDYKAVKWWERYGSWAMHTVALQEVARTLSIKSSSKMTTESAFWLCCDFDSTVFEHEPNLVQQDNGYLPFRVNCGGCGIPKSPDHIPTYKFAMAKLEEVTNWLESDPVVDGLTLSQHRWNEVARILRSKQKREHKDATAKMGDPAFTRTEAKAFIEAMRRRGDYTIYMKGREGSDYECRDVCVEAISTWVKSTSFGGGSTRRVAFTEAGYTISKAKLLSNLQEKYSATKNNHWKEELK